MIHRILVSGEWFRKTSLWGKFGLFGSHIIRLMENSEKKDFSKLYIENVNFE